MFEKVGRKIDKLIDTCLVMNRHTPWYKFYCFFKILSRQEMQDKKFIDVLYEINYLYDWQYRQLARKVSEKNKIRKM